jgi:O-antigen ligase
VLAMPFAYLFFRLRLTRYLATIGITFLIVAGIYYSIDNRYLNLAPNFERTIYHQNLGDHLSATFDGTDVSFMERIYRWVAAVKMSADHPIVGFGPGNFYNFYQYYTVTGFKTYVSDNPEKSGVHNYFLMTTVEQGYVGVAIFIALLIAFFVNGERIYQLQTTPEQRRFVMCLLVSQFVIFLNITMSDLIEVDKIGSLFFMNIAMLINQDRQNVIMNYKL